MRNFTLLFILTFLFTTSLYAKPKPFIYLKNTKSKKLVELRYKQKMYVACIDTSLLKLANRAELFGSNQPVYSLRIIGVNRDTAYFANQVKIPLSHIDSVYSGKRENAGILGAGIAMLVTSGVLIGVVKEPKFFPYVVGPVLAAGGFIVLFYFEKRWYNFSEWSLTEN